MPRRNYPPKRRHDYEEDVPEIPEHRRYEEMAGDIVTAGRRSLLILDHPSRYLRRQARENR